MIGIDIVTDPTIVQFEPVLFLVRFLNVPLVQFLDERRSAYYHQALYTGTLKTVGEFQVLVLAKLAVSIISKLTIIRRIKEHEIVRVVVLFEYLLETRV
jgi:hypothetical protein